MPCTSATRPPRAVRSGTRCRWRASRRDASRSSCAGQPSSRRTDMDIDMATLRMVEREREIPLDVLVTAIEQALLSAYQRTPGAQEHARVMLDRTTGHVSVLAREVLEASEDAADDSGEPRLGPEFDDTPEGFGR